jgi:uncharacterized coiled-coil protein SlyX
MIQKLIALIARRPTIEVALASLEKTLGHLDAVVVHQNTKADKHALLIEKTKAAEADALAAADRAQRVSARLASLLS